MTPTPPSAALTETAAHRERPISGATHVRSTAIVILAVLTSIVFIDWAEAVLLPLVISILLSYALDPLVASLERIRVPRPAGAALVLVALLGAVGAASLPLQYEAMAMLEKVPPALARFERDTARDNGNGEASVVEKAQQVAEKLEQVASAPLARQSDPGVMNVEIVEPPFDLRDWLLTSSSQALILITQTASVMFLVYFLLAIGTLYRRKIVHLAGPSFAKRRKMVLTLLEFHDQIRRFLFITLLGAAFVGVLSWLAFLLLGFEQAIFWGATAGIASAIPYLGPFLVLLGTGAAAFLQFGSLEMVTLVAGTSLVITSLQGYVLLPLLTSRVSSLNTVAIFVGLLFWGWIWGPMGLIIATPLLMIMKTLCDRLAGLQPLGELLGK